MKRMSMREDADQNKDDSDHDMEDVVNPRPFKEALGEDSEIARQRLINVNQAEPDVEGFDRRRVIAHHDDGADHPENNVEDVVGRRAAGRVFAGWDDES